MRVPDSYLDSAMFIGTYVDGKFEPHGTAFAIFIKEEGEVFQHVITARHIIDRISLDEIALRINLAGDDTGCEVVQTKKIDWILAEHTGGDMHIDIAALPSRLSSKKYRILNIDIENDLLKSSDIEKSDFGLGDEVFYVGLLTSYYGKERNYPMVRTGTIASAGDEPCQTQIGYVDGFLIEARSIGGTSGSPVWTSIPPMKIVDGEIKKMVGIKPHYFFGMICGTWYTSNPPDGFWEGLKVPLAHIQTGISIVIPGNEIMKVLKMNELVRQRKEVIEEKRTRGSNGFRFTSGNQSLSAEDDASSTRDEILKVMLNTPPTPHKDPAA